MKKLLSVAFASLAISAMADYSPTIGVTAVQTTYKNTIVAVPFQSLAKSANISVTDLVSTNGLPLDTELYVYFGDQYYYWYLGADGWTTTPGSSTSGAEISATLNDSMKDKVAPGGAIWVVLPSIPNGTQNIYIYGSVPASTALTLVAGKANLVANPIQGAAYVTVTNPTKGDVITVPNDTANPDTYTYSYRKSLQAYRWVKNDAERTSAENLNGVTFAVGRGFWYNSKGETAPSISWTAQ